MSAHNYRNLPDFDDLPPVEGMPQGCSWGVFDKDGKKDPYGCINLLTPDVVQDAYKEATDGESVSLNWPIGALSTPAFYRKGLEHKVLFFKEDNPIKLHGFDDEITFNTQCSSQWDSLVHVGHQATGLSYNGCNPTKDSLTQPFGKWDVDRDLPTLNHWHDRGGIVGRGVLLDYRRYAEAKGIKYTPFESHTMTLAALEDCARFQGTELKFGDILVIKSGFTEDLSGMNAEEQAAALSSHRYVGVEGNVNTARWAWNHHFAAVAGDMPAFEVCPPLKEDGTETGYDGLVVHEWFLSLMGINLGELWDLSALSKMCEKKGRWSFLLTSIPLNVKGAVGSPPNALALF